MGGAVKNGRTLPAGIRVLGPYGEARVLELWVARGPVEPAMARPAVLPKAGRLARWLVRLLVALAALQVLDLVSTLLLLSIGGVEANPVSAWLLSYGVGAFVATKLGLAALLLAFVPRLRRERQPGLRTAMWTCAGFDAVYVLAVVSNLVQFAVFA